MDIPKKPTQMMYDPETGLSDSNLLSISCQKETPFETVWQGTGSAGNLAFHHINVREGLDIWRFEHLFSRQIAISSQGGLHNVAFRFCLQGESSIYHVGEQKKCDMMAGQQYLFYGSDTENISSLPADISVDVISIFVSLPYLSALLGNDVGLMPEGLCAVLDGKDEMLFQHSRGMTRAARMTLQRMINCPYVGVTRKLFCESCALELICLQLEAFRAEKSGSLRPETYRRPLHPNDRLRIKRIQERIKDNPGEVPGLSELAREAGMSQSKLSRLFREVYGVTVFAYLRNARLDIAAQMLAQGMTVTETAFSVGYENLSHFSKAFKMQFGELPSQYKS